MASETTNYKLIKPDEDDFYDIGVFNTNADAIDREIKTVSTPEFEDYEADGMEVPSAEEALASIVKGKSLGELFGNLKAFCKGVVTLGRLVNNFETTEPGYALDARAGKRLFDEITKLNSDYKIKDSGLIYVNLGTSGNQATFNVTFETPPMVFVQYYNSITGGGVAPDVYEITTEGFMFNVKWSIATTETSKKSAVFWLAVGQ